MSETPIIKTGAPGNQHVLVYPDRFEVRKPRALTLWLSSKVEVYPWGTVRDVQTRGGVVTVHYGPLSVRNYSIGKKNAGVFLDTFRQWHADR